MKFPITCGACVRMVPPKTSINFVLYSEDGRYETTCPYDHAAATILQEQKFEILFQIAAHAILDDYYREAVSSFSSSMERFQEFAIRCLLTKNGIKKETVNKGWKIVTNQSERQLGAFVFLWTNHFGDVPATISGNQLKFRNAVIHKGLIPTYNEAVAYGSYLLEVIRPQMNLLKQQLREQVTLLIGQHMREVQERTGEVTSSMGGGTILSLATAVDDPIPLEQHLKELREWRRLVKKVALAQVPVLYEDGSETGTGSD